LEAVAYLDMANGDVDRAITNVREDFGWSAEEGKIETVIAGTSGASSSSRIIATGRGDRHRRGLTHSKVRAYWTSPSAASARTLARFRGLRMAYILLWWGEI
jgi:hypothetical protein